MNQPIPTDSAIDRGRNQLIAWRGSDNGQWYADNAALVAMVRRYAPHVDSQGHAHLAQYGQQMAAAEHLVHRCSHDPYLPTLERFDYVGRRHERVRFDGAYHEFGALVYASGVMTLTGQPGRGVEQAVLTLLTAHHGEAGHTCPLACTAGMIKAIQRCGHPALRAGLLPGLADPRYATRLHGAQFLTEVQGGSDVGANATRASLVHPESAAAPALWALCGEKWFCSVIDAPLYVLTARPDGAAEGTKGLGLFLVPHDLPKAGEVAQKSMSHRGFEPPREVNHFTIRRLKHKLGTRAMASGEVDWQGALAWQLGPLDQGFHHVVDIVLNTSRLFNAMACSGMMWRSWLEAQGFARHREAFGQPVARFANCDAMLAKIYADSCAATASTLDLVALQDSGAHPEALRMGLNMNKYWTSVRATQTIRDAMEVIGGNAAIEDFTPLGRLYRDSLVTESWEGAHNVLIAQTWRDMQKLHLHEAWCDWLARRMDDLTGSTVQLTLTERMAGLRTAAAQLVASRNPDDARAARAWVESAMVVHQGVCLAELAGDGAVPLDVAAHLLSLFPVRPATATVGWWPGKGR